MKLVKVFVLFLSAIIFCSILYGFLFSNFSADGQALLDITWGVITLIDIYIMFTLFSLWILYREGFGIKALLLICLVFVLGSLAACLYTLYALVKSKGNWKYLWESNK